MALKLNDNYVKNFISDDEIKAMAGAVEGVKKKARFIAGSNNEGGVVKAIREITGV